MCIRQKSTSYSIALESFIFARINHAPFVFSLFLLLQMLQSPMAIVFRNKVELSEHQFAGTIYGLLRDTITSVSIIIYGHRT